MLGGALLVVLAAFTGQVEASETWNSHFGTDIKGYFTQTGTVTNLAQSAAAVKTFIQLRKDMQNVMTNTQDIWKRELDHNTLLQYERRNLEYGNNAMSNANMYYQELKYRLLTRNAQLEAENNAYNASVQLNEQVIKFINQTNMWLDTHSEALDAQNIELMAEVGVLRDGHVDASGRTFGLTRQRQNSVQRKILNHATWQAVQTLAHADRVLKEKEIKDVTLLRVKKNEAMVANTGHEPHVATLTAQRNMQQTQKLLETHKKRNMETRRDNYKVQVPALTASQLALEAELKSLVIENDRLREIQREREEQRLDIKKDRDLQKWNFIHALLQKNKFLTYAAAMKQAWNATYIERDAIQAELANKTTLRANAMVSLTDCEEENRVLTQHKSVLKQRNAMLCANCWHKHSNCSA